MKTDMIKLDVFTKQYLEDLMTFKDLSLIYNMSISTLRRYAVENGIKIRPKGNIKEKEYHLVSPFKQEIKDVELFKKLFNECVSVKEIAKILGICDKAVYRKIKELSLIRPKSMMSREQYDDSKDKKIIELYNEGKSSTEIGKIVGLTHKSVLNHLEHCGIKRRSLSESQFNYNGKEFPEKLKSFETLYDMYVENKMSKKDIAEELGVSTHVIDRVLKSFGIHVRNSSESKVGLCAGFKHPNWKGGRTNLYARIRTFFRVSQVRQILKRDKNTCQMCGDKKKLQIHHIKPFKVIFNEIISEHPELDISKDKEELYNIMISDSRMNDLNNLITYCKNCHYKVHGYKIKLKKNND